MARTIVTRTDLEAAKRSGVLRKQAPGAPQSLESTAGAFEEGVVSAGGVDGYFDRLAKYIPGEAVALYVTLGGIVKGSQFSDLPGLNWGVFGFALLFTPFYLAKVAGVSKGTQIAVSTVAFAVWALAIGGALQTAVVDALAPAMAEKADALVALMSSLALVVFTALVPVFAPGAGPVQDSGATG